MTTKHFTATLVSVAIALLAAPTAVADVRMSALRLLLPLVAVGAALSIAAAEAGAASYVARPADGGRIALELEDGRLRRAVAKVPARCENNHGGSWDATLAIDLRGSVPLRSGRFGIQGQTANEVRSTSAAGCATKRFRAVSDSRSCTSTSSESTTPMSATRGTRRY